MVLDNESKAISFAPQYLIFQDGRIYSMKTNRFMRYRETKSRNGKKIYYSIMIGRKSYLISRLVMFMFGQHNFESIEKMPKVVQLDNNTLNFHILNLKFVNQRDINLYHNVKPNDICYQRAYDVNHKINETEIEIVKFLRSKGKTLKQIGRLYNTTEMSVHRFIKKHNI